MRDIKIIPNEITLSTVMSAAPTAEADVLVESLLRDFPDAVQRHPGWFTALLSLLRDKRDYVDMQHWWLEMRKRNITPDKVTLSIMMSEAPTSEAAIRLMKSFLEDYPDTVQRHPGCFTALLSLLRDKHDYVDMQHWWHEMCRRNITPDGFTLSTMMSAAPRSEAAIRLMKSFLDKERQVQEN